METLILNLADSRADLETVGGKGMSLAKMLNAGLPVPGGFHITTEAYRCFVSANSIQAPILAALRGVDPKDTQALETASQAIRQLFNAGRVPPEIAAAISGAYRELKEAPVAVRSSATAEDLPDASFAGQQETYLNIRGDAALLTAVKNCWASLWTARAIAYRLLNQVDQAAVALAVVVQELVFADAAGVLFTANPVNGKRDELVINAAWGLGEAVVSGAVTPDTLVVKKDSMRILRRETAAKQLMTVRTELGTHEAAVPAAQVKKPVLNDAQAVELARLGLKIEQFYAMPMDVEWVLSTVGFAIVQARPITALPLEWKIPDPDAIYARGSLAEHTPGPVTPLFATFGLEFANAATEAMWQRIIGKESKRLIAKGGFYQVINGYVYGGVRMRIKDMYYLIRMSLSQIGPMFHGSVPRWQAFRKEFAAEIKPWQQRTVEELTPSELLEGASVLFGAACRYFTDIQTTLPAASSSETIFTLFYKRLIQRKEDPPATVFLLGLENTALRAEKSLYNLSEWIKTDPALANSIMTTPTEILAANMAGETAPENLSPDLWSEWRQRFQRHLDEFGCTAYEFDFANPTPLDMPGPLLDALKGFLSGAAQNPHQRQNEAVEKREEATRAVLKRVGWPRKDWFVKLLRWTQDTGPMREDAIFDMGMAHPFIRRMLIELGARLTAGGAIARPEDVFWLEKPEVSAQIAALENGQPLTDLNARVVKRKKQGQIYRKASAPVMLPEKSGWLKLIGGGESKKKAGKTVLKGVGTSSGTITAPACVVLGPEDFGKLKPGDVLVAVTTNPAWTPLFALASAVVTDIGGPLSHSSIVAREYGIPAVMAARSATHRIQTGQMITVDGSAGTVTLILNPHQMIFDKQKQ